MASSAAPRVVLVDDHALFRAGLRELLREDGMEVAGEAGDGEEAVGLVATEVPDVVVMDIHMPGMSGIEATRRVREASPRTRVLMLTISADEEQVTKAVVAGACGYLLKDAPPDQIIAGVRSALAGESLLSPRIAADLLERLRGDATTEAGRERVALTAREREVLQLMAAGKENPEIAAELFISSETVKNHVSNILAKLEVQNRIQAAVYAVRRRLI